jgi:hypothetical protein
MDPLITAAARALAPADPLGALKRVALPDGPPANARISQNTSLKFLGVTSD